jgi:hypothetical protein
VEHRNRDQDEEEGVLYRLEVQGAIRSEWSRWFGADTVTPAGPNTLIQVRVADQSDLYGRLRRIHDLNLQLVSVQRMEGRAPNMDASDAPVDEGRARSQGDPRSASTEGADHDPA